MNDVSLMTIPYVRIFFIIIAVSCLFALHIQGVVNKRALAATVLATFFYAYGFALGFDNLHLLNSFSSLATSLSVVVVGVFFLANARRNSEWESVSRSFVIFSVLIFLFLSFTGGITLLPTPRYNFDLYTDLGARLSYTQGISRLFGMSSIFSFWLYQCAQQRKFRTIYILLAALFLLLSVVGGARGEIISLFAVILMMYFRLGWRGIGKGAVIMLCLYFFALGALHMLPLVVEDLVVVARFNQVLSGALGSRDILVLESIRLLRDNPECVLHGCGYTFFQAYHGYAYGLYPHNIYLEAIITWGVPGIALLFLAVVGLLKRPEMGAVLWVGLFSFLIGFKSGDLIGSWFALSFLFYLGGVGVMVIAQGNFRYRGLRRERPRNFAAGLRRGDS